MQWDEQFAIGHKLIDRQHREFFDRLRALAKAMERGAGAAVVADLVGFLEQHVLEHFEAEEGLMVWIAYPDLDRHREQHQGLLERVTAFKAILDAEGPTSELAVDVLHHLFQWLRNHILFEDRMMGIFAEQSGRLASFPRCSAPKGRGLDMIVEPVIGARQAQHPR